MGTSQKPGWSRPVLPRRRAGLGVTSQLCSLHRRTHPTGPTQHICSRSRAASPKARCGRALA